MKTYLSPAAQRAVQSVIENINSGKEFQVKQIALIPNDGHPARHWSFMNRFLATVLTGSPMCMGYRQWEKFGYHVKKGAKGGFILVPLLKKIAEDEESGEPIKQLVGFKSVIVFPPSAVEPIQGVEQVDFEYHPQQMPPLAEIADWLNIKIIWEKGEAYGSTDGKSYIKLATENPGVFFHELAHVVDGKINKKLKGGQHVDQEIVAEWSAAALTQLYAPQVEYMGETIQYIKYYGGDMTEKLLFELLSRVQGVVSYIENLKNTIEQEQLETSHS